MLETIWTNGVYSLERDLFTKSYGMFKRTQLANGTTYLKQVIPWYKSRRICVRNFRKFYPLECATTYYLC